VRAWLWLLCLTGLAWSAPGLIEVKGGRFTPLYSLEQGPNQQPRSVVVKPFQIQSKAVTNQDYLEFVTENPQWRRSRVATVFVESNYLKHWQSDLAFEPGLAHRPVVFVSWFAARAYCQARGLRLPTILEWEFVGLASERHEDGQADRDFQKRILDWYSRPARLDLPEVSDTFRNVYGVYGLHGVIWEWVDDFQSVMLSGEGREGGGLDRALYCAAGVSGSANPQDYAGYMRYAFRSSLQGRYCLANLGFRCAQGDPSTKGRRR